MLAQIIKNEWLFLIRSRIFLAVSMTFIFILLVSVFLGHLQTAKQDQTFNKAKDHVRQQWVSIDDMNPHSAAHYGTYIFKPANLLSSLDQGVTSVTGNVLRVEGHVQNEIVHSEASQMQAVSRFGNLKSALLLQYIVPLLLIFLAFNSVSSEKQSGRLKLLILQGARLKQLILSKTVTIWLYGLFLLVFVIVINGVLNFEYITTDISIRTGLFFLSYALYYFIISALTVFFSARWQNATLALTSMLGIWILWTIFLPNILMSAAEKWHPLPSRNDFKTAMTEDRAKGLDGHNPTDKRALELEKEILQKYRVDSLSQLPINFDGIRMQADEEYGNSVWDKHFGSNRNILKKQKQSVQIAGIFNPFIALQNTSMGFMASDNLHHQEFLLQVENYRRMFIKMLNDKHTYGGSKTGNWGWTIDNTFFKSVPDFDYKPTPLSLVLSNYILDLGLLVVWSIIVIAVIILGTRKIQIV
jgi:ABC-2 type transport system permease protein